MPDVGQYVKVSLDETETMDPVDRNRIIKEREAMLRPALQVILPSLKGVNREAAQFEVNMVVNQLYPNNSRAVMLARGKYAAKHIGVALGDMDALKFGAKISDQDYRTGWNVASDKRKAEMLKAALSPSSD